MSPLIVSNWSPAALRPDTIAYQVAERELGSQGLRLALATAGAEPPGPPGPPAPLPPRRPELGTARPSTLLPSVGWASPSASVLLQLHKVEAPVSATTSSGAGRVVSGPGSGRGPGAHSSCLPPPSWPPQRPLQLFAKSAPLSKVPSPGVQTRPPLTDPCRGVSLQR